MTPTERLASAREKVARAKHHIKDLARAIEGFEDTNPYAVDADNDLEKGQFVQRLVRVDDVPLSIAAVVGDIIFDLRSALDHVAYQLILVATGKEALSETEARNIYFPVANDAATLPSVCTAKVNNARQDALDLIRDIEPHRGGKGHVLWTLHKLNLTDKHRLLLTTVVVTTEVSVTTRNVAKTAHLSIGIPRHWALMLAMRTGGVGQFKVQGWGGNANPKQPMKVGDVLYRGAIAASEHEDVEFDFQVALNEPGVVDCEPLLPLMQSMVHFVESLLPRFESVLL